MLQGRGYRVVVLPRATFLRRLVAIILDWFASILVSVLVGGWFVDGVRYGSTESALITLAVFFVEVTVLTALLGGSFGQVLLGVRVLRVDGVRLGPGRCAVRTLLLCLVIPAVVFDSDGRGLHDRAVGSQVVYVRG